MNRIKTIPIILSVLVYTAENFAGPLSVLDFGARRDGVTDDTKAIQAAVDSAAQSGGTVFMPAGRYLVAGSIRLCGVSLQGENLAPRSWTPLNGTVILATGGRDDESAPALFEMRNSSAVAGLTVYYPGQSVDSIRPYPWSFRIGSDRLDEPVFDCTIENITLINSYNGIRTGPSENGRHRINSVFGCVLRRGIFIMSTGDIGRVENVQFHCHFWAHGPTTGGDFGKVFEYMQRNLEAFIIGRSDWEYVTNTFVFPAFIGYRFIRTETAAGWNGGCNGQFSGIAADATETCVRVDEIQPPGLLITNGQFNSHLAGEATQIIVGPANAGNVRFVNCGFWGPVRHNAVIRGAGSVSFADCYFSNNNRTDEFSIVAEGGRVQIHNCTFDAAQSANVAGTWSYDGERTQPPAVRIGKDVKHAIVAENDGAFGVSILNEAGERAVIRDNETAFDPAEKGR
jgi:hypothetical protein